MRIAVIGTGYVGLVSGTCFAEAGNDVVCVDIDEHKIARLNAGEIPIHEPGLEPMVARNRAAGRLAFGTSLARAVEEAGGIELYFIAVGTPPDEDGSADLRHVLAAARSIGRVIRGHAVIVDKSTVPVGTADAVRAAITEELAARGAASSVSFDVVSNPEFLKEGAAIEDFMRPDRVVVGSQEPQSIELMRRLYAPFCRNHDKLIVTDIRSAELTKYAANAMLATRISFMNELANLAERLGADIEAVRRGIGSDPRIGTHFLYAGVGYGGSCFPKDVKALLRTGADHEVSMELLRAVETVNEQQKTKLFDKMAAHCGGAAKLAGKVVALWGLAFKPNTDDMREAPSRVLAAQLIEAGCRIRVYDPVAMPEAKRLFDVELPGAVASGAITLHDSAKAAADGADLLAVVTEWQEFRSPDFRWLAATLRERAVFDGRNLFDPAEVASHGLVHYGIGRSGARAG